MPKTQSAFAFRDFDGERILQRRYFKDFSFDSTKTDAEILASMGANDFDSFETTQKKLDALGVVLVKATEYQKHMKRHGKRLTKYAYAVAKKIAIDEKADISALRARHKRAEELSMKYCGCISDTDGTTTFFQGGITVEVVGSLCQRIAESYKELDEKIKTHYRNIFAERLKEARRKAELTQAELSKSLGLTKNAVSNYEQAIREPTLATLVRFSQKLKKPVGWFLGVE